MPALLLYSLIGIILFFQLVAPAALRADTLLALTHAESLALNEAPWLAHHRSNADAAAQRVVYEGRLPDPQLVLGAINVPTDTFKFDQDDMTMTMVGIRQSFPAGDTLALKSQRARKELTREQANTEVERRKLLKQVRETWLELYFQQESLRLLQEALLLQRKQTDAAQNRYRAAIDTQQMSLRARQALARLNEREPMLKAQIARSRAHLRRWIGDAALQPLPNELPALPEPASDFTIAQHPEWLANDAMRDAAGIEADIARQEYKPAWMLDLSYGVRQPMPNGTERANMVTAMVTLDLPVFRGKRQDPRLAEKLALENGTRYEAEDKRRELEAMYQSVLADYAAQTERAKIFEEQLMPAIRRESKTSLAGSARDRSDIREAQMKAFEAEQEYTRVRVDRAKAQAELLYLTGEQP